MTAETPVAESALPVPRHLAVIMDGNGRWATQRHLPRIAGHQRGLDALRKTVAACLERGIEYLTVFAFSSENWRRPPDEVSFLMRLFMLALQREVRELDRVGVRLKIVGELSAFDPAIREMADKAEAKTAANTKLTLTIAANYGGRWDLLQATQKLIAQAQAQGEAFDPAQLDEDAIAAQLAMAYAPEPDLFIRTGGEQRISNFLLWQLAYTELYFTDVWWPDFDAQALDDALACYRQRERRFGRTSAQLAQSH